MIKLFNRSAQGDEAAFRLGRLTSIQDTAWHLPVMNEGTLRSKFLEGLDDEIQDEIAAHELPHELDALMDLDLHVKDRILRRCQRHSWRLEESLSHQTGLSSFQPPLPDPEPIQLGHLHLTPQERQRLTQGLCLNTLPLSVL